MLSVPPDPNAMYISDGSLCFTYCINFLSVFGPDTTPSFGFLSFTPFGVIITLSPFFIILSTGNISSAFSSECPSVIPFVIAIIGSFIFRLCLMLSPLVRVFAILGLLCIHFVHVANESEIPLLKIHCVHGANESEIPLLKKGVDIIIPTPFC